MEISTDDAFFFQYKNRNRFNSCSGSFAILRIAYFLCTFVYFCVLSNVFFRVHKSIKL